MATWTTIPDAALNPAAPIRSIDAKALRDNVTALAEGATGAPKVQTAALDTNSVLEAIARDFSIPSGICPVGTITLLANYGSSNFTAGSTYAGSGLQFCGFDVGTSLGFTASATYQTGSWMAMGFSNYSGTATRAMIFMRVL